jgi:1,4-alpha-glucan branching enzyme
MTSVTLLGDEGLRRFRKGNHLKLYDKLGSRPWSHEGKEGVYFAVWAPGAARVSVIGDFNGWAPDSHPLRPHLDSGIWEGFFPGLRPGAMYKYHIVSRQDGTQFEKADPYAFHTEVSPQTASFVWTLDYAWNDQRWMQGRHQRGAVDEPIAIYEVHLGSWRRPDDGEGRFYNYRELAPLLAEHVRRTGFTHVEFLPVMEHPFYASWGYQTTGYYAPTSRYGTPQDFMYLIDYLHQNDIGVILDWVPSHFPNDPHGLGLFDGTHLYEYSDPRKGVHAEWNSYVFDYTRGEVRSFLLSNAMFWLDKFHADGLRVDAVASMLYLDYARGPGQWVPNARGGRENLEAIAFLREFNGTVQTHYPDVITVAEESTAWPMVSRPAHLGGLGFNYKWDMGWMHDTLVYLCHDPIHRQYHQDKLTFRMVYAFNENYILPLSHDEVKPGVGSLLQKMPGDQWQKFANLRLLLGYMYLQPAKKILFMGGEFGANREWHHDVPLDWSQLALPAHEGVQRWVEDLNRVYRAEPALHQFDCDPAGFEWIDCSDNVNSVLVFLRKGREGQLPVLVACNFTPVPRSDYRVGVPREGFWEEILNSDAAHYGGSGRGNTGGLEASPLPSHGRSCSLNLTLPPLGVVALKAKG